MLNQWRLSLNYQVKVTKWIFLKTNILKRLQNTSDALSVVKNSDGGLNIGAMLKHLTDKNLLK